MLPHHFPVSVVSELKLQTIPAAAALDGTAGMEKSGFGLF